jgi:hypothetical protein
MAKTNAPDTWADYDAAVAATTRYGLAGIGFVFTAGDPFAGVDLDNCRSRETGAIALWAQRIITELNSYSEVSPSGTGVKIVLVGKLAENAKHKATYETGEVEMYDHGRFFTVTGEHVAGTPSTIENRQTELMAVYASVFVTNATTANNGARTARALNAGEIGILPEGERNDGLTRYGGALRRKGWTYEQIEIALEAANVRRCRPPLDQWEIRKIAASVAKYPAGGPDPLEQAWQAIEEETYPSGYARFLSLCEYMQAPRPGHAFPVVLTRIAELMQCDWTQVRRWRRHAVREGRLVPAVPCVPHRRAAQYHYLECPTRRESPCPTRDKPETVPLGKGPIRKSPISGLVGHPSTSGTPTIESPSGTPAQDDSGKSAYSENAVPEIPETGKNEIPETDKTGKVSGCYLEFEL